jgi:hypothetical protein
MPDPADHSSLVQSALEYMTSVAPPDVADTVTWLTNEGWTPTSGRGGKQEGFGNVLVEFGKGDGAVKIARDRSIWEMTLRLRGWQSWFGLDIIMDARAERTTWAPLDRNLYEVEQIPEGDRWTRSLPEIVSWLTRTTDVEALLDECRMRRFHILFPTLKPQPDRQ